MRKKWIAIVLLACLACSSALAQDGVPTMRVPFTANPPTIDGVIDPDEWAGAVAVTGFVVPGGALITPPDAVFYLMHDWDHIYMAVRSNFQPGQTPSRRFRRRDEPVYRETNIEIWLTPPIDDTKTWAYQFIGNAYGAIFDNLQHPELGVTNVSWDGDWTFRNTWEAGEYWDAEIKIPVADLGIPRMTPGQVWRSMAGVSGPQRSFPHTAGWYKNVHTHTLTVMGDDASAVQVLGVGNVLDNKIDIDLNITAGKAGEYTAEAKLGDITITESIQMQQNARGTISIKRDLEETRDIRTLELTVKGPDGIVLFDGHWKFRLGVEARDVRIREPERPFAMEVNYGVESKAIRVWSDLLEYERYDDVKTAVISVFPEDEPQRVIKTRSVTQFDYDQVEIYMWLEGMMPGKYTLKVDYLDDAGNVLDSNHRVFEDLDLEKEFIWYNNDLGMNYQIGDDFSPISREGNNLSVWGRTYSFDNGVLPSQIVSLDAPMLSRPISLVLERNGVKTIAEPVGQVRITSITSEIVTLEGDYRAPGFSATLTGYLEFDGMIYYEMNTDSNEPVDSLYISMALNNENALYYHTSVSGWAGAAGRIPRQAANEPAWISDMLGDFLPYFGISDDDRALVWFADDDHNWILGNDRPCIELWRNAGEGELRVNLVRTNGSVPAMKDVKFGFIATPVKPLPEGWRNIALHNSPVANSNPTFFYGAGHGGGLGLHDSRKLLEHLGVEIPEGKTADEVLANLPLDKQAIVRSTSTTGNALMCPFHNARMLFEGTRAPAFRVFFPAEWREYPPGGWFHLTPVKSYQDFYLWYFDKWIKHLSVKAVYYDEVYAPRNFNVFNGSGKIMPDGSIRPSVNLMPQRQYMRRMRQLFMDNNVEPFIWVHSSNYMAPHAISWTTIAMFGEDRGATETSDFIQSTPEEVFLAYGRSQKYGLPSLWMNMTGRGGGGHGSMGFFSRQTCGWPWMFDTLAEMHTAIRGRYEQALRVAWGLAENDVEFQGYWKQQIVKTNDEDFIVSIWTRPGTALLQVFNLSHDKNKTNVELAIDAAALGLGAGVKVYDLESEPGFAALQPELERFYAGELDNAEARTLRNQLSSPKVEAMDLTNLKAVGDARSARITIQPRDFRLLVIK